MDSKWRGEAETFVSIMRELAPEVRLDYSPKSLDELDAFITKRFEPLGSRRVGDSLIVGVGCYVGEVIIRTIGGHWGSAGGPEVDEIGGVQAVFPLQKAVKRFRNGAVDSLSFYYAAIKKHAGK